MPIEDSWPALDRPEARTQIQFRVGAHDRTITIRFSRRTEGGRAVKACLTLKELEDLQVALEYYKQQMKEKPNDDFIV